LTKTRIEPKSSSVSTCTTVPDEHVAHERKNEIQKCRVCNKQKYVTDGLIGLDFCGTYSK